MMKHFMFAACLLGLSASAVAQENIKVGNDTRNMIVYAPKNLPDNPPLVITLHGANQDAAYQQSNTQWNNVADTAKIVVVYPNAINKFWDTGCRRGSGDMLFITTIIDEMAKRYNINRNRVYISGFSLGAMMTYNCMEEISDLVAACAPVSGVRFDNRAPKASRQVPFIHTHGTGDDVFKWVGDPGHMAGGYPYIPDYVQKWATYYKCTDKEFVQPYPANKSGSKDAKTYWRQPGTNFEIQLLQLDGVGHWHSDAQGWGGISTTQEIWRFMRRYSLGPDAPKVKGVEPENNSFDLTQEHRTFTVTLAKEADCAQAAAKLVSGKTTIKLALAETGTSKTLTFNVPEGVKIADGEYTLSVTGIAAEDGCMANSLTAKYIYGISEVGDVLTVDTLLAPNWPSMQEELGQCIPYGWKLTNYTGTSSSAVASGTANMSSGCRLLYFPVGGDFTAGFYLSARDMDKAMLSYGRYAAHRLTMKPGTYDLSFRSCFWSTGSRDANATFDVCLQQFSNGKNAVVFEANGVTSKGCVGEKITNKPRGTQLHQYLVTVPEKSYYSLDFTMTQGWNSVLLADVTMTATIPIPEQYKGEFHRLMLKAEAICASSDIAALDPLREAVEKYRDFASTSPTAYTEAIKVLNTAMKCVPTGIEAVAPAVVEGVRWYDLQGRRMDAPQRGVNIERTKAGVRKVIIK